MTATEMWSAFCRETGLDEATPYEAWAFGGAPDELAELVVKGIKTGTASGYDLYQLPGEEPLPEVGEYSVILDSQDRAQCIIQTTAVSIHPFSEVSADHAWKEGEGDRSLAYWRQVHEDFFTEDFASCGLTFTKDSRIVCEEFRVVYLPEQSRD